MPRYVVLVEHAAEADTPEEAVAVVQARLAPCELGEPPAADGSDGEREHLPGWYVRISLAKPPVAYTIVPLIVAPQIIFA